MNRNKQQDQEEYTELQRELHMDYEILETAKQLQLQNFYKSKNGKLNSVPFHLVKEKQPPRNITQLHNNNTTVTDLEQIVQIMQDWYNHTVNTAQPQRETLSDFKNDFNLDLPQISPEHHDMLAKEITEGEVEDAIKEAQEISAPGPLGQTLTLYKLLFQEIPSIFMSAINQLVFNNELADEKEFQLIKERKIIYILKKPNPLTPGDFRPLSMLEILYKIPSRILARRLSLTLPTIIGEHQHGFMSGKGIQEPSLLATHLVQILIVLGNPNKSSAQT
jgi:hypothetical protein